MHVSAPKQLTSAFVSKDERKSAQITTVDLLQCFTKKQRAHRSLTCGNARLNEVHANAAAHHTGADDADRVDRHEVLHVHAADLPCPTRDTQAYGMSGCATK